MNKLREFIASFIENKGLYVFLSFVVSKVCPLISSIFIIRFLSKGEVGLIAMITSVFTIFVSLNGFGSNIGLLRFGAIEQNNKNALSAYAFWKGFLYQVIVNIAFFIIAFFYMNGNDFLWLLIGAFSVRLVGFFLQNHILAYYRVIEDNETFAIINTSVHIVGLVLLLSLTYFFQLKGYLIALALTPFFTLFWYKQQVLKKDILKLNRKEFWQYSIYGSGNNILSILLFTLDIILLGYFHNEIDVANYKVAILIPSNIIFLSQVLLHTDYVKLSKNYQNYTFLKNYIFNYYKLFIPFSFIVLGISVVLSKQILTIVFSAKYANESLPFTILMIAFSSTLLLRNIYGGLLSAVGKMKENAIVSAISVIVLIVASYLLVPTQNVLGMAIAVLITFLVNGLLYAAFFLQYLQKIKLLTK